MSLVKVQPIQVERYGQAVWENPEVEAIRKESCMCLHCGRMKPGQPDHCLIAVSFYEICKVHGTAFILCRCDSWTPK